VEDGVLLTQLERDLLAKKEIQELAMLELPKVASSLNPLTSQPIMKIELEFDISTLPDDVDAILELKLSLDIWQSSMSIFIARYREGKTWPKDFGFEEPEYMEFYRVDRPRVDVWFKWMNYVQRMGRHITDFDSYPCIYDLNFDGRDIRPGTMPTKFEIPSLASLASMESRFTLSAHRVGLGATEEVSGTTDIQIELHGEVGEERVCLYRSRTTYTQEVVLECPWFAPEMHPIYREAVLARYLSGESLKSMMNTTASKIRTELQDVIYKVEVDWNTFQFQTNEERHFVARSRYSTGRARESRGLRRDAMKMYMDAAELFYSLRRTDRPALRHDFMLFESAFRTVALWLGEKRVDNAAYMLERVNLIMTLIFENNPTEPDYRRFKADLEILAAEVRAGENKKDLAVQHLAKSIEIYADLYNELSSSARRIAWLEILTNAVNYLQTWGISSCRELATWREQLRRELGEEVAERVTKFRALTQLPVWLQKKTVASWPVKPVSSTSLRYSLHIREG
jgi:hypothetical protein